MGQTAPSLEQPSAVQHGDHQSDGIKPEHMKNIHQLYKAKIEIFSILDIYTHTFNSSGALQKYYATKKWLESGLLYEESIEHIMEGYMESPKWR